jgi:DNA-binding MarR family transcriptional regulator
MKEITQLIRVMETIRKKINSDMPTQQVHILLTVADNPGITMPELSKKLDMNQGTVSRNTKILGTYIEKADADKAKKSKKAADLKGYDLLRTEPDMYNRKALAVFLTKKGEQVVKQLAKVLEQKPPAGRHDDQVAAH